MYTLRTRFKKEIVSEFLKPQKSSRKVVILLGGMPSYPGKKDEVMFFLAKKGYWVFRPRYRGTWESAGVFLEKSPHLDVLDVMNGIEDGFVDLWDSKKYKVQKPEFTIIGSSFGGAPALMAASDSRVKKVIALSPITDWRDETELEPIDRMGKFVKQAFGDAYRYSMKDWAKLKSGTFCNPISVADLIPGEKCFILHAVDDVVVYARTSAIFAKTADASLKLLPKGGHLSLSQVPSLWKLIKPFMEKKQRSGKIG